jgi:CRISPR-associated protein Cas6
MEPVVDVKFGLTGRDLPADHGYALCGAVCRIVPSLHADKSVGIHPVSGRLAGNRLLALSPASALTIRIAADRIKDVLPLAGKTFDIEGHRVVVGVPAVYGIKPAARLYSRLVVIKGFTEPDGFLDAVRRQLKELGVNGKAALVDTSEAAAANKGKGGGTRSPVLRRTLRIRDKTIVGFAVRVSELTAEESILLQERGLGGRRRFGCGVMVPDREGR